MSQTFLSKDLVAALLEPPAYELILASLVLMIAPLDLGLGLVATLFRKEKS